VAWIVLILAGVLEAVWAIALGRADHSPWWLTATVFSVATAGSMVGLAYAMRTLPPGTAYVMWVTIGAALTIAYGMAAGDEPVSITRILLLLGLVGCVVGLKFAP
jgi:quaternary ammonium compound-resistance protein SugE